MKFFLFFLSALIISCGPSVEEFENIENELKTANYKLGLNKLELDKTKIELDKTKIELDKIKSKYITLESKVEAKNLELNSIYEELESNRYILDATKKELDSVNKRLKKATDEKDKFDKNLNSLLQEVKDSLYIIVNEIKNKNYANDSPGLFVSGGTLLKRDGYDQSLLNPKDDKIFYYNLISDIINENSEYFQFRSRAELATILEHWEKNQVRHIKNECKNLARLEYEWRDEQINKLGDLISLERKLFKSNMDGFALELMNYINCITIK